MNGHSIPQDYNHVPSLKLHNRLIFCTFSVQVGQVAGLTVLIAGSLGLELRAAVTAERFANAVQATHVVTKSVFVGECLPAHCTQLRDTKKDKNSCKDVIWRQQ